MKVADAVLSDLYRPEYEAMELVEKLGGVGRDAAGPVGAQAAAHALEAKAALGPLGLHPVVGGLHGQAADILQRQRRQCRRLRQRRL